MSASLCMHVGVYTTVCACMLVFDCRYMHANASISLPACWCNSVGPPLLLHFCW